MSQAALDRGQNWGERGGGMSDPTLFDKVGVLTPNTPEELAILRSHILRSFPTMGIAHTHARAELSAMLLDIPWDEKSAA